MTVPSENQDKSLVLDITGMSCEHCVARVRKAIDTTAGVRGSDVAIGGAKVTFDPAAVSADEIAAAVTRAGYPAHAA